MKPKMEYHVVPNLPSQLETIRRLSYNVCFSWKDDIYDLFQRIDPGLWEDCKHNPVMLLGLVSQERLNELARDPSFVAQLERVSEDFDRYLSQPRIQMADYVGDAPFQVAYFSAEFGLTECLPIYSGGLGVLAGDHLKSASDLNVPLVGVGLAYQEGYFSQYLTSDGWQMETYPVNDFANMPMQRVRSESGEPLAITVDFKGEPVQVHIWQINVGRVRLFLLDTNLEVNPPHYRGTTGQLYGGDRDMRIRQEIVLGIGGIRALKAMGIEPTVIHMNEGHSAFSALERINILRKEKGLSFDAAREVVLSSTVFTTHTPVPAGNDVFEPQLVLEYFREYVKELGISFKVLQGYGRLHPFDEHEPFGMTTLALRLSAHTNGVSRLHRTVSRAMWRDVWPQHPLEDVPIDYITNGIHVPTWTSRNMGALLDRYLGPYWAEDPDTAQVWKQIEEIPVTELWRTHVRCREQLIGFTRRRLMEQLKNRGASTLEVQAASEVLTPEALTIGFARRFATYKRATLLFRDPERLARIINHPERPVQVVIAGKAHPQDNEGKAFIKSIIHLLRESRFRGRIVFLEDYNLRIGRVLVSGTDLWLNTPRRPLEACGTSGMKAVANGSLNFSVLDGWWDEGYAPEYGWTIGHGEVYEDHVAQDNIEARDMYNLLEEEIVPLFYQRGRDGIPRGWVEKMRLALAHLGPVYNAHRMVQEYTRRYYLPCTKQFNLLCADDFKSASELASWRQKLMVSWKDMSVVEVLSESRAEKSVGQRLLVQATVRLGSLSTEDITVEAYFGKLDQHNEFMESDTIVLKPMEEGDGVHIFQGDIPCQNTGRFGYTVRITPSHNRLENPFAMGLVTWA